MSKNNFDNNKEKLIEFFRLFFKQHYGSNPPVNKFKLNHQDKMLRDYENEKHKFNNKCPVADRYTQEETEYLIENNFINRVILDEKGYSYYQPIKRSLTQRLLDKAAQVDFPIVFDRLLNINLAYGLTLTFPITKKIILFKAIEEEAFIGYFAVSNEGRLALILKDKAENVSQVILTSKHTAYELIYILYRTKENQNTSNETISLEDFNTAFKIKTNGLSLLDYIDKTLDANEKKNLYDIDDCSSELVSTHMINFLIHRRNYVFDVYTNGRIDLEKFKIWFMLDDLLRYINDPDSNLSESPAELRLLHLILNETEYNKPFRMQRRLISNINFDNDITEGITGGRILRIEGYPANPRTSEIRTIKSGIATLNLLRIDNGMLYLFNGNKYINFFDPDDQMDTFNGIINDDYAFQLLEMLYVGQTTIIESTPQ
ncbi:hypothetical protein SOX05_08620 [Pseudomonas putida]|nr:hypothetical protein [Pseudomonas putida]MDY4319324.1 hypothetical protein [Pseudomonas putida]MDY4352709.1 hypothetical protein [Pseudomonas putida]